ncbi:MAG: calcium-binding protein [Cyanobacteria bacterium P01_A01_bin.114]
MTPISDLIPDPIVDLSLIPIGNVKVGTSADDRLEADDNTGWSLSGLEGNDTLIGRGGDDYLEGGSDSDELFGAGGNDTLKGGAGADDLVGGAGNDAYLISSNLDDIIESSGQNGGIDTVFLIDWNLAPADPYVLPAYVEDLKMKETFTGERAEGNDLSNNMAGNSADNDIYGRLGDDTLKGKDGSDHLYGEEGNDLVMGGDGSDVLYGDFGGTSATGGDDTLIGGEGNDQLYGGAGEDSLTGYQSGFTLGQSDTLDGGSTAVLGFGDNASDTFVLGDANGLFYLDGGAFIDGYATITNFEYDMDTIVINGSFSDYTFIEDNLGVGNLASNDLVVAQVSDPNNMIAVIADISTINASSFTFI